MEMYNIKIKNNKNLIKKLFYATREISKEYDRKIIMGFNAVNLPSRIFTKLKKEILNCGMKVFLSTDFPPCVFSYVAKYKMCDFSINLEFKNGNYYIVLFGGSGYPVCSYQKKIFLNYMSNYKPTNFSKGEVFNLKLETSMNQYIKYIFGKKSKNVKYIKNVYNLFYFKVNDSYYVLDKYFSKIMNKNNKFICEKLKDKISKTYPFKIEDNEFDVYQYMLSRKIPCIFISDGSIIFENSYYIDYLRLIYYLEFLC